MIGFECECGESHAEPSTDDARLCTECQNIRRRVANLDPELLRLRNQDIRKEDSIYSGVQDCRSQGFEGSQAEIPAN